MTTLVKLNNNSPAFNSFFDDFFRRDLHAGYGKARIAVNVKETKEAFHLEVVAPGFKRKDFSISIEDNYLKIQGKVEDSKTENNENTTEKYSVKEYHKASFEKAYKLSNEVDAERINAKYESGILDIEIPKKSKEETKTVRSINVG
jgi:HSP20 family protein